MRTMTITYSVNIIFEDGYIKPVNKIHRTEASAEATAFWLLGGKTARGIVVGAQVVDSDGSVLNEFEY